MLDTAYLKQLLEIVGNASYMGVENGHLMEKLAPEKDQPVESTEEGQKFKYHMDEAWAAGLIRDRDDSSIEHWGLKIGASGDWFYVARSLVLTPLGGELLEELSKPKGLERLKQGIRNAGAAAGSEALRFGVGALLKAATS